MQVSYAITAAAKAAAAKGELPGTAPPHKRARTDDGGAGANGVADPPPKLFVEKPSPVALAKAIKNTVTSKFVLSQSLRGHDTTWSQSDSVSKNAIATPQHR